MSDLITRARQVASAAPIISQVTEKKYYGDEDYADYPSRAWDKASSMVDRVEDAQVITEHKELHIGKEIYQQLADKLKEVIDGRGYISNMSVESEPDDNDTTHVLTVSTFISYEPVLAPDGSWSKISNLNPTWWEVHSYKGSDNDEILNNFSFDEFKKYI